MAKKIDSVIKDALTEAVSGLLPKAAFAVAMSALSDSTERAIRTPRVSEKSLGDVYEISRRTGGKLHNHPDGPAVEVRCVWTDALLKTASCRTPGVLDSVTTYNHDPKTGEVTTTVTNAPQLLLRD